MLHIIDNTNRAQFSDLLEKMFADRKRIFIDTLKWDLPVTRGHYEIDQFDDDHAVYLIASDHAGRHLGSLRLLRTDRPHILSELFPALCDQSIPRGALIREVTRFCASPAVEKHHRRVMRDTLITAMVDHALDSGISALTGVVTSHFLDQILAMGWRCDPLGERIVMCNANIGAFCAHVDENTPRKLEQTGIYRSEPWQEDDRLEKAPALLVSAWWPSQSDAIIGRLLPKAIASFLT
jgi:N-acyl-L-homoserine lactone synthetase